MLQILGISVAAFSQLSCAVHDTGKLTEPLLNAAERFSQRMSISDKPSVTKFFQQVDPKHLTEDFLTRVVTLTEGILYGKRFVFDSLATVPAECLTEDFLTRVVTLTEGMQPDHKCDVIKALAIVSPQILTDLFWDTVGHFSNRMQSYEKANLITNVLRFPAQKLAEISTDPFLRKRVECFCNEKRRMLGFDKTSLIRLLAKVNRERLTEDFLIKLANLTNEVHPNDKALVISALAIVPAELLTEDFLTWAANLTNQISPGDKALVIKALAIVPAENLTRKLEDFEAMVTSTAKEMKENDQSEEHSVAKAILKVAAPARLNLLERLSQGRELYRAQKYSLLDDLLDFREENIQALSDALLADLFNLSDALLADLFNSNTLTVSDSVGNAKLCELMESLAKATPDEYERTARDFAIELIFESKPEPESEAETEYDDEDNDRPSKRRRNNS